MNWFARKTNAMPSEKDLIELLNKNTDFPNTPDVIVLNRLDYHLLFVYGTQMRGHPEHELVINYGAYAACGFTVGDFTVWKKCLGNESFPIALNNSGWTKPDWNRPPLAKVQGELYLIETSQLKQLDKHYSNTLEFERTRVSIVIPYSNLHRIPGTEMQRRIHESLNLDPPTQVVTTEKKTHIVRAFMYIGKSEYWTNQLDRFYAPVQLYTPRSAWLSDYYAFTDQEYNPNFKPEQDKKPTFDWKEFQLKREQTS